MNPEAGGPQPGATGAAHENLDTNDTTVAPCADQGAQSGRRATEHERLAQALAHDLGPLFAQSISGWAELKRLHPRLETVARNLILQGPKGLSAARASVRLVVGGDGEALRIAGSRLLQIISGTPPVKNALLCAKW